MPLFKWCRLHSYLFSGHILFTLSYCNIDTLKEETKTAQQALKMCLKAAVASCGTASQGDHSGSDSSGASILPCAHEERQHMKLSATRQVAALYLPPYVLPACLLSTMSRRMSYHSDVTHPVTSFAEDLEQLCHSARIPRQCGEQQRFEKRVGHTFCLF